ncbi:MAG: T9SS type A sorting domain-containing protein, partial [Calditrichia bacterium]|nr:T9SS type A sorting domain-containing protein [Calditrichia bacterium]
YFFHAPENWFGTDTLQLVVSDGMFSDSADLIVNVTAVNDTPQISVPYDTITFSNDSSATLNLWDFVSDVETTDENLIYGFYFESAELNIQFSVIEGSLEISAFENFTGNANLTIEIEDEGNIAAADSLIINITPPVNITDPFNSTIPKSYYLTQNYPNPFNPETIIRYGIPQPSHVSLEIYNIMGQKVQVLVNVKKLPGNYQVKFNPSHLPSGIYIYRMKTEQFNRIKKMLFLK